MQSRILRGFVFTVLALVVLASQAAAAVIDNVNARYDTNGSIIDAHDGCLMEFGGKYYLYGTAYGNTDGFSFSNRYRCYSSSDLTTWKLESADLLANQGAPQGTYFRPYTVYNASTHKYVLWFNWFDRMLPPPPQWTIQGGYYGVATSDSPQGPFTVQTWKTSVVFTNVGDLGLCVDDSGAGYVIHNGSGGMTIEKLTADYLSTTGQRYDFGINGVEAPAMFKRGGLYYALFDNNCAFCSQGSGAQVWTSSNALGPYQYRGNINRNGSGGIVIPAQQTYVSKLSSANGDVFVWMGDLWTSTPDGQKGHDRQYWGAPLQFNADGSIAGMSWVSQWTLTTNVVPVGPNLGFESPATASYLLNPSGAGWNFFSEWAGISANGSGFTSGNPNAPEGRQVAYLQSTGHFSQSLTFAAGAWSLQYSCAQRGNFNHGGQDFQVLIDGVRVDSFRPPGTSYVDHTTSAITLVAGSHVVDFVGLDTAGGDNTAFIDNIRIVPGTVVNPQPNGGSNLGFEAPATSSFLYDPSGAGWTFSSGSGVTANASAFTWMNPNAPEGAQVAFVQGSGDLRQALNVQAGTYVITFRAAQRANWQASWQVIRITVDGQSVGDVRPAGSSYELATTNAFTIASTGAHTVAFIGINPNGGDNTAFIDDVRIAASSVAVSGANVSFEAPSTAMYVYNPVGYGWTFLTWSGVTGNANPFTSGNPNAPLGAQVAFLQNTGSFSQAFTFQAGTYSITYAAAQRGNFNHGGQDLQVFIDGTLIDTWKPAGTSYADRTTATFTVGPGAHTVKFVGLDSVGGDNTAFIDNIRFNQAMPSANG